MSGFLDRAYGFVPVAVPITEPAVGLGAVLALAFIDQQDTQAGAGFGRPNISVVGGLGTENGTRGFFFGDVRHWQGDRLQTLVGGVRTTVHLDYYGSGEQGFLNRHPASYDLDLTGLYLQGKGRLGDSPNWVGLGYLLARTEARPGTDQDAWLADARAVRIGGLSLSVTHDSRDNMFTPTRGLYLEASATRFDRALGSDLDFTRYNLVGMQYLPLDDRWFLGLRESLSGNDGNTPFYMQPFVMMRGVPAMRYQGDAVAQMEAELRWQCWGRFSLLGFAGVGAAADRIGDLTRERQVTAGGVGMRYELAEKYGLHVGLDLARSRDGNAVYIQFGSAWMRP